MEFKRESQGFTMIELVIVVVIIGLLAMVGIPKYLSMMDKARVVGVQSQAAIFSGSVLGVRTQWVANSRSKKLSGGQAFNHTDFDGYEFWLTDKRAGFRNEGYPIVVSSKGDYTTNISDQDCVDLMHALLQNPPKVLPIGMANELEQQNSTFDRQNSKVRYLAQAQDRACQYFQQEGANHSFLYEMETGQVSVNLQP